MALRNGLLVHGPTHWAAAVRARRRDDRRRLGRASRGSAAPLDGVPGVRGVVRLGEAMAVIPLVKRALPEARLPFQDATRRSARWPPRALARRAAAPPGQGRPAARPRWRRSRSRRRSSRCAAATSPPTTASSTRRSAPTSRTPTTPRDAAKEHDRCGSHLDGAAAGRQPRGHGCCCAALVERPRRRPRRGRASSPRSAPRSRSSRGPSATRGTRDRARAAPPRARAAARARHARARPSAARGRARRARRDPARRVNALTADAARLQARPALPMRGGVAPLAIAIALALTDADADARRRGSTRSPTASPSWARSRRRPASPTASRASPTTGRACSRSSSCSR